VSNESHASSPSVTCSTFCWSGRGLGLFGDRLRAGDVGVCIWLAIIDGVDALRDSRGSGAITSMGNDATGSCAVGFERSVGVLHQWTASLPRCLGEGSST